MSHKPMKVFKKTATALGFEQEVSWIRFDAYDGLIHIDSCNYDGCPSLTPEQASELIKWMQKAMVRMAQKPKKGSTK